MDEFIVIEYGTPRIAGKRINVYDIMDGLRQNWPPSRIAEWFEISVEQVNRGHSIHRGEPLGR